MERIKVKIGPLPPIFKILKLFFPKMESGKVVFTLGNTIYSEHPITKSTRIHEAVHCRQHRFSKLFSFFYVILYIMFRDFRYRAELEAFREQFQKFKENGCLDDYDDFLDPKEYLGRLAFLLSGPGYGHLVTFNKAKEDISK